MTPEPLPASTAESAMYLAATERQMTVPHYGARQPLPPARGLAGWLRAHGGRIAPGAVTTAAWALALAWHQQTGGSAEPLWTMGALTALSGMAGIVSAAKQNGSEGITGVAFAAAGTSAMVGVAAWSPHWPVSVLMWLLATAAAYALCAPHWRRERREQVSHAHAVEMEQVRGYHRWVQTATEVQGQVQIEALRTQREQAVVDRIVAASTARTEREIAPGQELNVEALLLAAGHEAPSEPAAQQREKELPR